MVSVYVAYAFFLLALTVFLGALAMYAWDHRDRRGAAPFAVMISGGAIWSACAAAALLTRGTPWALFWSRAWYVGVVINMAGLFVFALEFTGHEQYLGRRTYALLAVEPIALLTVAVFFPEWLYTIEGGSAGQMLGFEIIEGTAFWLHAAYSYLLVAVSSILIVRFALTSNTVHRKQALAMVAAVLIPWFGNAYYLFTDFGIDTTPLTFGFTGLALAYAVFRAGLLDISPVAHREVVASLSSGVFVVDDDNRLTEVNDAGAELIGGRGIVGRPVTTAVSDWPALRAVLSDDGDSTERRKEIERDGRYFEARVTPLYDDRGDSIGRIALVHEITDQKARQQELQRRNRQLDQFASVVSHDLRNPLSVASGSLELARQTDNKEQFDRVERAHERMESLIDEVLALAREEGGSEATEHSLAELARTAWGHVATDGATLDVETDYVVVGNEEQLLQLFENAFRNSVEHQSASAATNGDAGVTVTVSPIEGSEGDGPRGFAIADNGPGIPADEREEVFDHGYTTTEDGTGFGLAIIEHVATSHDWSIRAAESDAGGLSLEITDVEMRMPAAESMADV